VCFFCIRVLSSDSPPAQAHSRRPPPGHKEPGRGRAAREYGTQPQRLGRWLLWGLFLLLPGAAIFFNLRAYILFVARDAAQRIPEKFFELAGFGGQGARFDIQILNGLPALLIAFTDQSPRQAPRLVQQTTLTPEGDVKDIYAILAPRKLTAVHFVSGDSYDDTNTE